MSIANYSDLQGAISDWLARDELDSRLPDFIALTESRIQRELDTTEAESTSTLVGTAGGQTVFALPGR